MSADHLSPSQALRPEKRPHNIKALAAEPQQREFTGRKKNEPPYIQENYTFGKAHADRIGLTVNLH